MNPQAGNAEALANVGMNPQVAPEAVSKETEAQTSIGAEQLLALLNKAMDKIGSSEKNPLEMLTALKKLSKEI